MPHFTATVQEDRTLKLPPAAAALLEPGQLVEVDVAESRSNGKPGPNYGMLAFLKRMEERHQGQPTHDGSKTVEMIREARSGPLYGYEPGE